MKTKWFSKFLTSLLAITLIFGSVSLASAKGSDKGNSEQKGNGQGQKEDKSSDKKDNEQGQTEDKSTDKQDDEQGQKEDKSSDKKDDEQGQTEDRSTDKQDDEQSQKEGKSSDQKLNNKGQKENKSTDKKINTKSETKKKVDIKSKSGKTVEKRLNAVDSTINSMIKSINTYFGVNEDGTVDKELSKKIASKKYNSYKGKLKAEINKLRAIDKQLASYKKKQKANTADFTALLTKSKELQKLAADEIQRVKSLAEQASAPKTEDVTTTEDPTTEDTTTIDTTVPEDPTTQTEPADAGNQIEPSL